MKIIHQNGYSNAELHSFRATIFRNLVDSAQDVVLAMRKLGVDPKLPENRQNAEKIMDYRVEQFLGIPQSAMGALIGDPIANGSGKERQMTGDSRDRDYIVYPPRDVIQGNPDSTQKVELDPEIVQAIHALWADPIISELMDHSSDFYLMDSAP